jgi:hypothetical protein
MTSKEAVTDHQHAPSTAPDGPATLTAARRSGSIDGFIGILRDKVSRPLSLDDMDRAIAAGWAGEL